MTDNQWDRWHHAMAGHRIETERGNVPSGYYKNNTSKGVEAICVYRDETGQLQCIRNIFGDGSNMDADQIEELVASCYLYPISYEDYAAVAERGDEFGPEFSTRLTMQEQKDGVVWTAELGRKKLAAKSLLVENERAVVGDNSQHAAPHELLAGRINDLADKRRSWLKEIGGEVRTQDHADKVADFKVAFAEIEKEADKTHKAEKEPFLKGGREIDARWKPIAALSDSAKRDSAALLTPYLRKQDDERREAARKAAEAARERQDNAPAPVEPVKARAGHSGRGVSLRTVSRTVVTDLPKLAAYLAALPMPPDDLVEVCRKLATREINRGVPVPGAKIESSQEAA